jgi:hypothetical protein
MIHDTLASAHRVTGTTFGADAEFHSAAAQPASS